MITMNLKLSDIWIILRAVFIYLFLYVTFKIDHLTSANDIRWKIEPKNISSGPIYTYLKTDKNANVKWGVRHYVPRASRTVKNIAYRNII